MCVNQKIHAKLCFRISGAYNQAERSHKRLCLQEFVTASLFNFSSINFRTTLVQSNHLATQD